MTAFLAKGVFKDYDDAIENMVRERDVFMPNEENHRVYTELYNKAYSNLASRLKPIEKTLHNFQTGGK